MKNVLNRVFRNGTLIVAIVLVWLVSASRALTLSVMAEIAGYAALAVLVANISVYAFTQKNFTYDQNEGNYRVLAAIILGSFILVGLCVLGIYFAKVDGIPTSITSLQ